MYQAKIPGHMAGNFFRFFRCFLSTIIMVGCLLNPAHASFDFDSYQNTLDTMFDNGDSPIKSGYRIAFTENIGTGQFVYYLYDPITGDITKKSYDHNLYLGSGPYLSTRLTNTSKDTVWDSASFYGINVALINKGDGGDASDTANKRGEISEIYADFFANSYDTTGGGGAAIQNDGIIGTIYGDFVRNWVRNNGYSVFGGAILNGVNTSNAETYITEINGNFIRNYINDRSGANAHGGAIANYRYIGTINGDFIGNYLLSDYNGSPLGGAIYNASGLIGTINGDFYSNRATNSSFYYSTAAGGAILNLATINEINGDFNGNYVIGSQSMGGAILNQGKTGNIIGNFINNYASGSSLGGAIANGQLLNVILFDPTVSDWDGANTNNPPPGTPSTPNPATIEIDLIRGNFINNYARGSNATGGAIYNIAKITEINADFTKNYISGTGNIYGGAIANSKNTGVISLIKNSSFYENSATNTHATNGLALGGAIYTYNNLNFVSDNTLSVFSGNYTQDIRGKIWNAIFIDTTIADLLNFDMSNSGAFIFKDNISGGIRSGNDIDYTNKYSINITGDDQNVFTMANDIINAENVNVTNAMLLFRESENGIGAFKPNADNSGTVVTTLNLDNAIFDTANGYLETVNLAKYTAKNNSFWHLDVNPDTMTSDVLNVNGDIIGTTQLVVHTTSDYDITNKGQILFATSVNNTAGTKDSFNVFRVYGRPYVYDTWYTDNGNNEKNWYFVMRDKGTNGSNTPNPIVTPEVISYIGLHAASLEQTRSMVANISNEIATEYIYDNDCCGVFDASFWSEPVNNLWISPTYQHSKIKKHVDMNANIAGIEAGIDRQFNENHKLGLFASYRSGDYNLAKEIGQFKSVEESEIDINSMALGLYYRYDKNRTWALATTYVGKQSAQFSAFGIDENTNGNQFGGSVEIGRVYPFGDNNQYTMEPSIVTRYAQIAFDDIKDNFGKEIEYSTIRQFEFEIGAKIEKTYHMKHGNNAKIHFKPSIIRPLTTGDSVKINQLGTTETYYDELLGRAEIGGKYNLNDTSYISGTANYTFGQNYRATSFRIGFSHAFGGSSNHSHSRCSHSGGACTILYPTPRKLELPNIHFDFDKSIIRDDDKKLLEKAANNLKEHGFDEINVIGHTDIKGSFEYNVKLSLRRAKAVANMMRELGIKVVNIGAESFTKPIADNKTINGRALNRRVELELISK